jgi:hypothetical protein
MNAGEIKLSGKIGEGQYLIVGCKGEAQGSYEVYNGLRLIQSGAEGGHAPVAVPFRQLASLGIQKEWEVGPLWHFDWRLLTNGRYGVECVVQQHMFARRGKPLFPSNHCQKEPQTKKKTPSECACAREHRPTV